jgi:hypothetical protein
MRMKSIQWAHYLHLRVEMHPLGTLELSSAIHHQESPIQALERAGQGSPSSPHGDSARSCLYGVAALGRKRQSFDINMDALGCVKRIKKTCSGVKKVKFAAYPVTFMPETTMQSPDHTLAWYDDVDYLQFETATRLTVLAAQRSLVTTGDWSTALDSTEHCLLGLEHYLSRNVGRAREMRVRMHCQRVLSFVQHPERQTACRQVGLHGVPTQL